MSYLNMIIVDSQFHCVCQIWDHELNRGRVLSQQKNAHEKS